MFEPFIITDYAIERYLERIGASKKEVMKRIKKDLHYSKVKRIVNKGKYRYVFTFNSKEFIFVNDNNRWVLRTVIKRNRKSSEYAIQERLKMA